MAIHENLTRVPKPQLREVGWSKAVELVKVARKDGEEFDCATWLHRAKELPKEGFKTEVERYLTGKETEPWEIIYFKLYKSQIPVVEQALETTALMLGSDKSRGYCLEMICADFLAGAILKTREARRRVLSVSERRLRMQNFARNILDLPSALKNMPFFVNKCFSAIGGDVKNAVHQHS